MGRLLQHTQSAQSQKSGLRCLTSLSTWQITGLQGVIVGHSDYNTFRFMFVKAVECDTDVAHVDITMAVIYIYTYTYISQLS